MVSQPVQPNPGFLNAIVYTDYENICQLLRQYRQDPLAIDFFRIIKKNLRETNLNIIDFIVYANFEKQSMGAKQQTQLRVMGLETRQTFNHGKNSGGLELTVDVARTLYKNPHINVFVIISRGHDIIPLLKAIKSENKFTYLISSRNGFHQTVIEHADFHEYLEDIFHLNEIAIDEVTVEEWIAPFDLSMVTPHEMKNAREVARRLYESQIWKRAAGRDEPVSLNGYIQVISKALSRSPVEILDDFKLAHHLKYVTIYQDPSRRLFLREGQRKEALHI